MLNPFLATNPCILELIIRDHSNELNQCNPTNNDFGYYPPGHIAYQVSFGDDQLPAELLGLYPPQFCQLISGSQ
jgi:hypothetical protein